MEHFQESIAKTSDVGKSDERKLRSGNTLFLLIFFPRFFLGVAAAYMKLNLKRENYFRHNLSLSDLDHDSTKTV